MELGLQNLKVNKKAKSAKKRLGRGNASGHGTYSGKGLKGQKSRSGGKRGLTRRSVKQLLLNKPKIGGFKSLKPKSETVNISLLEKFFAAGDMVDAKKLISKKMIKSRPVGLKILGQGKLTKKMTVVADNFSKTAKQAIIEAGGEAIIRTKKKK